MDKFLELLAILVLTIIGFVIPIIGLLLSIFNEGVQKLSTQYTIEKEKSQENITNQLQKIKKIDGNNLKDLQQNLKELEKINKTAQSKLNFLNPQRQIIYLSVPLFASFILISSFFITKSHEYQLPLIPPQVITYGPATIGISLFFYSMTILWKQLNIITEIVGLLNNSRKETDAKVVELLSQLLEKTKSVTDFFVKNISLKIDSVKMKEGSTINLKSDEKTTWKISAVNSERLMAKNVEIGFILPTEFLIEKSQQYSISNGTEGQVIRFKVESIQGDTNYILGNLTITALKKGVVEILTFIKGENIESAYTRIKFSVQ